MSSQAYVPSALVRAPPAPQPDARVGGAQSEARRWEHDGASAWETRTLASRSCCYQTETDRKGGSSINNVLGSRMTLLLGTTGYALYIGSYLCVRR